MQPGIVVLKCNIVWLGLRPKLIEEIAELKYSECKTSLGLDEEKLSGYPKALRRRILTVSYTHLDVYKRQTYRNRQY